MVRLVPALERFFGSLTGRRVDALERRALRVSDDPDFDRIGKEGANCHPRLAVHFNQMGAKNVEGVGVLAAQNALDLFARGRGLGKVFGARGHRRDST